MDDFLSNAIGETDKFADAAKAIGPWSERYPHLADLLKGAKAGGGKANRFPGSVRIFTNAGEVKCELSGEHWVMRGYLVLPRGVMSIDAIEEELKAGRIGWSLRSERKDSKTGIPY